MAFRACPRKDDPFERRVRETYGANVVRAPREGIDPLTTVARQDDRWSPRGHLRYVLDGAPPEFPPVISSPAAAMSGTRSAEVNAKLGLDLSAKFLSALGLPVPTAGDGPHQAGPADGREGRPPSVAVGIAPRTFARADRRAVWLRPRR
jgi:hypothetical protein